MSRQRVIDMDNAGKIPRNLEDPPFKDTVIVPDSGFVILRFLADNPGYWLLHCHMSWHNHLGMGLVIKVYCILPFSRGRKISAQANGRNAYFCRSETWARTFPSLRRTFPLVETFITKLKRIISNLN